jgi:hypothetical protein
MFEVIIERAKKAIEYEFNQSKYVTNIFNKKFNEEIAHYYIDFIHYIEEDTSDVFYIETIEEETKQKLRSKDQIPNLNEDEKNLLVHLVTLHVARRLNSLSALQVGQEITYSELAKLDKKLSTFWFRGQSDYSYNLTPSFYRGKEDHGTINLAKLKGYYNSKGILSKLSYIFPRRELDFSQLSFIQHSIQKTPLLDFTKDPFVAALFALDSKVINDASVFKLNTNKANIIKVTELELADKLIQKINVEYYNNKPEITTLIKSKLFRSLVDGTTQSEVYLIDIATNDRMRIQKGTFVLFNNVIFVDQNMIVSTNTKNDLVGSITKHMIRKSTKEKLLLSIKRRSKTKRNCYNYLMEPYQYLEHNE